jgi:predicted transcriptional regulator
VGRRVMDLTFLSKRRNSLVISIAILKAAKKGIRKTHLLASLSLSYEQFMRYIEFLKAHGFVEECGNLYKTTNEGLELIEEFNSSLLIRSILGT